MQPLRVFELLDTFSAQELDGLVNFIRFNAPGIRKDVHHMLAVYSRKRKEPLDVKWTRPKVHSVLYEQERFNDKKIRYLLTDLNKQCQQFLAYQEFKANPEEVKSHTSAAMAKRDCPRSYTAHLNRCRKGRDDSRFSPDSYFSQYHLGITEAEWQLNHGTRSPGEMEDVLEHLDRFYLVKKLQLCCEALNVSNILAKEQRLFMFENIVNELENHPFKDVPHVAIYLAIIHTLRSPEDDSHFTRLMILMQTHQERIERDDLRGMYHYVLNYSIKKINEGDSYHRKILFGNYRLMVNNGIILQDNQISQWDYKNLVTISLRQNELQFANEFIHGFRKHLPPDVRENAFQYNLAYLRFAQNRFKEAIKGLQQVELDDVYYQLDVRSILLKSYYELNDTDALFYQANSFRTFIRRNKSISSYQRTVYANLIKLTLALTRAGVNKARLKRVRQRLDRDSRVADLQWIEAKLNELGA